MPDSTLDQLGGQEILDSLADGTYITDIQRRIVFWSRAAVRLTGWQPGDVVGRTCADNILVHVDKDGHALCGEEHCPLHRSMITGETSSAPVLVFAQHKAGHRIPVEVSVAPIRDQAGQVIGGIEVFRDLTEVFDDLRRAKVIQDHALDCHLPPDDRIRIRVRSSPSELVGGDFHRVEQIDRDRYAVLVADVMGHGVAAALYTMQLRLLWEDGRAELGSPGAFLSRLNHRLQKLINPEGYFATATCLTLDLATGDLLYVRAGHPAPFLFRHGGGVQRLDQRAPALGLYPGTAYLHTSESMQPGDLLLLCTDGALEITNAAGNDLGEEGLLRLLEGENFRAGTVDLTHIESKLLAYSNQLHLNDDLTLVSLQRLK